MELSADQKPPTAHISRVETTVGGTEVEIFRRSSAVRGARENGPSFVAFSAECSRYDLLLSRMFGTAPGGAPNRLTDLSHPVTGSYCFAPSLNTLNDLGGPE